MSANTEKVKESLNKKYTEVSGQNKLKGKLFPKLINEANEIVEGANDEKTKSKGQIQ